MRDSSTIAWTGLVAGFMWLLIAILGVSMKKNIVRNASRKNRDE